MSKQTLLIRETGITEIPFIKNGGRVGTLLRPRGFIVSRTPWANDEAVYPPYKKHEVHG